MTPNKPGGLSLRCLSLVELKNTVFVENGVVIEDEQIIAHKYNHYHSDCTPPCSNDTNPLFYMDMHANYFFCFPFEPQKILNTLSNLKNNSIF